MLLALTTAKWLMKKKNHPVLLIWFPPHPLNPSKGEECTFLPQFLSSGTDPGTATG